MTKAPFPGQEAGMRAAQAASRRRVETLLLLHQGILSLSELFALLRADRTGPLRRIKIGEALRSARMSGPEISRAIASMTEMVGSPAARARGDKLTLEWLFDTRAVGRRTSALEDAFAPKQKPWPGYPLAPEPR